MSAQRKILPILWIVVMLTILACAYAWYSSETATIASIRFSTGVPASFSLTVNGVASDDSSFDVGDLGLNIYQGQQAFDENNEAFDSNNADYKYVVYTNLEYTMKSSKTSTLFINIIRVEIELGSFYAYSLDDTIANVIGATGVTSANKNNYYSTSINNSPEGTNPSKFYCVYDSQNDKVTHLVILENEIYKYFEYDYWDNGKIGSASDRGYCDFTSIVNGIDLQYGTRTSETGVKNFVGIHIGFCGYNDTKSSYCETFKFSDDMYQESTFKFVLEAEGVEKA